MLIRLLLTVGLFLIGCNSCYKRTEVKPDAPQVADLEVALAKTVVQRMSPFERKMTDGKAEEVMAQKGGVANLEYFQRVEEKQGFQALRKQALQKGYYISDKSVGLGLFEVTNRTDDALVVKPIVAALDDATKAKGTAYLDEVGGELFFIASSWGLDRIKTFADEGVTDFRASLESAPWPKAMVQLAEASTSIIPQTRYHSECRVDAHWTLRNALVSFAGPTLRRYNKSSDATDSTALKVNKLMTSAAEEASPCSFIALHWLGGGLSPSTVIEPSDVVSAARLVFLGRLLRACAKANPGSTIEDFSSCAFDFLMNVSSEGLEIHLRELGKHVDDWEYGASMLKLLVNNAPKSEQRRLIQRFVELGFFDPSWFSILDISTSGLPKEIEVVLTREYFGPDGDYRAIQTAESVPIREGTPFPFVVYAASGNTTLDYDLCQTPILFRDSWWRVCPVKESPVRKN